MRRGDREDLRSFKMAKRRRKGFTLIELLIVIAIIAVLLSILAPALSTAKAQAKQSVCKAHLRGLGNAFVMYVEDNKGKTHDAPNQGLWDNAWEQPDVVVPYEPDHENAYWGIAYQKYSSGKNIFHCPSHIRVDDWVEWGWGEPYQIYFWYCSYGLNNYISDSKISNFKFPDEVIVAQDHIEQRLDSINSDMFCIGPTVTINLTQWRNGGTYGNYPNSLEECFRHRGNSNTLWLDGHVTQIPFTDGKDPFYVPCRWYDPLNDSHWKVW